MKYSFYYVGLENERFYPRDLSIYNYTWWNTNNKKETVYFPSLSTIRFFIKKYNEFNPKYPLMNPKIFNK